MREIALLVTATRFAKEQRHKNLISSALDCWWTQVTERLLIPKLSPSSLLVVGGDCVGGDESCEEWAVKKGASYQRFKADWEGLGRIAGPIRNQAMVEHLVHLRDSLGHYVECYAFPAQNRESRGTRGCMSLADSAGIKVTWMPLVISEEIHDKRL